MKHFFTRLLPFIFVFWGQNVFAQCDSTFTFSLTSPTCAGDPITFSPSGNPANITQYRWSFGDGSISIQDTVDHQYPYYRNDTCYNVSLTVTDTNGATCTMIQQLCLLASPEIAIIGTFNGCRRNLTDTATFNALFVIDTLITNMGLAPFEWDFGDGSPNVITTSDTVTHIYTNFGRYRLKVTSPGRPCAVFRQEIDFFTDPIADVDLLNGPTFCEGDTVCLQNRSDPNRGPVDYFQWDFDDGTIIRANDTSGQKYVYNLNSTNIGPNGTLFFVELQASNTCFTHRTTVQVTIESKPRANFTVNPQIACMPNPLVRFTNTSFPSSPSFSRFRWDFGDPASGVNNTSTARNPVHLYSDTGIYVVTLFVQNLANRCGDDMTTATVEVLEPPTALAVASDSLGCDSLDVDYTNLSYSKRRLTSRWSVTSPPGGGSYFINGTDRDSEDASIRFIGVGRHIVQLRVDNPCGFDIWLDTVEIAAIPEIDLQAFPDSCGPVRFRPQALFEINNDSLSQVLWQFTGGNPGSFSGQNPAFVTFSDSLNRIEVSATNRCGTRTVFTEFILRDLPILQAGPDIRLCAGDDTVSLSPLPVGGIWSSDSSVVDSLGNFFSTQNGSYELIYTFTEQGCPAVNDTVFAFVDTLPLVLAPPVFERCFGDTAVALTGTPAGGTFFSNVAGLIVKDTLYPDFVGTFTIYYQYRDSVSTCENIDSTQVTIHPLPVVNAGLDTTFCLTSQAQQLIPLSQTGGRWTGNCVDSAGMIVPLCLLPDTQATMYYTFTDVNGCVDLDSLILTVVEPDTAQTMPDDTLCRNAAVVNLIASPVGGIWESMSPGFVAPDLFDPLLGNTGPNILTYTIFKNGSCEQTDTLILTILDTTSLVAGPPVQACSNAAIFALTGYSPTGGRWIGPGVVNDSLGQIDPSSLTANIYELTYIFENAAGCESRVKRQLTIVDPTPIDAGPDTTFCFTTDPQQLFPPSIAGGTWSGNCVSATGEVIPSCIGPNMQTTAFYTFVDGNGCVSIDSLTISVVPAATPQTMPDDTLCRNDAVINLMANPAMGVWTSTSPGFMAPAQFEPLSGNLGQNEFIYTIFKNTSCEQSDTLYLTVDDTTVVMAGPPVQACNNDTSFLLTGYSPAGGTWSGTGIVNGITGEVDPRGLTAGNYTLTYTFTNAANCTSEGLRTLIIDEPTPVDAGFDTLFCLTNDPQQIPSGLPLGGSWSGPCIAANGVVVPSCIGANMTAMVYYTFADSNGCVSVDSLQISVVPPTVPQTMADDTLCRNEAIITLTAVPVGGIWTSASPGFSAADQFDPLLGSTGANIFIYTVFANTSCQQSDTLIITVSDTPTVVTGPPLTLCTNGLNVLLTGFSPTGGTWSGPGIVDGATGEINPRSLAAGNYTLTYTYTDPITLCTSMAQRSLDVFDPPVALLSVPPLVCKNDSIAFSSPSIGIAAYHWDFGVMGTNTDTSILPTPRYAYGDTGVYTITLVVANSAGCRDTTDASLYVSEAPRPSFITNPDTACSIYNILPGFNGIVVDFTDTSVPADGSYIWDFGGGKDSLGNGQIAGPVTPRVFFEQGSIDTTYYISLTISNSCDTVTYIDSVVVRPVPIVTFGPDVSQGCSPFCPNWTNISTGSPTTYEWYVDGVFWSNDSIPPNRCFTYVGPTSTTYTIRLIAKNACGVDTAEHIITVFPNTVDPFFNTDVTRGCPPLTVNFVSLSGAPNRSFDLGDGTSSQLDTIQHVYTRPGTYLVQHFVDNGCSYDTGTIVITVFPIPNVRITPRDTVVCPGQTVTLSDSAFSGNTIAYRWDLDNGNTSIQTSPQVSYNTPGLYRIHVRAQTVTNGCPATDSTTIRVLPKPSVTFQLSDTSGCPPLDVQVTGLAPGARAYAWDFGDGNSSVLRLPLHRYTRSGNFTMSLVVDDGICQADTTANIRVFPVPTAAFRPRTDSLCGTAASLLFLNNSQGAGALGYQWDFGDTNTSITTSPSHVYNQAGQFTVSLIAENAFGCADTTEEQVWVFPQPDAQLSVSTSQGCGPLLVEIDNLSPSTTFTNVDLYLGDGSLDLSPRFPFRHTYQTGFNDTSFIATLAMDFGNFCFDTARQRVTIFSAPVADFSITPDSLCGTPAPVSTQNLSTSSTNISRYIWDWDDGSSPANTRSPSHSYTATGDYMVSMIVENPATCRDTASKPVVVIPQPTAVFNATPTEGCYELAVTFNSASLDYTGLTWDFGDGTTAQGPNVSHVYQGQSRQTFTAKLIADNQGFCFDEFEVEIDAEVIPEAAFSFVSRGNICTEPVEVIFTNLSTRINSGTSFLWEFGNGQTSTDFAPTHIYPEEGTYEVLLIVTNAFGCSDTFSEIIPYPRPRADFEVANAQGCAPLPVQFRNLSTSATEWYWLFGDGQISVEENPVHVYTEPGLYTVSLVIGYDGSCRDTIAKQAVEVFSTPVAGFTYGDLFPGNPTLQLRFKDESPVPGTLFLWDFGDGETSTEQNPVHQYAENGSYVVTFITTLSNGCADTTQQIVIPEAIGTLFIPNAFAPDIGQGEDAIFLPKGVGLMEYHIAVYNHWGNLVWESTALTDGGSPAEGWDGSVNGVRVNGNVFVWKIHRARFLDGTIWREKKEGTLTLIR
ncbi:MAG: PKD domain-containing protein [Bacteroidia bacterium]